MMWGRVCRICGLFSAIGFCLLVLNSFGCNYEMTLQSDEARYYGVCHGGKVTFLEQDAQRIAWRVSGFQLPVGQQVFLWITNREPLHDQADTDSRLEAFNQTQRNRFVLVNFAWQMLTPEKIAVFQHSPHPEISVGELHGWMDLTHRFWPARPLDSPPPHVNPVAAQVN